MKISDLVILGAYAVGVAGSVIGIVWSYKITGRSKKRRG